MNAWSHLPNAWHIDRIIASAKAHPNIWYAARDAVGVAVWNAVRAAACDASRAAACDAAYDAALDVVGVAAGGPILALIAYDDSAKYLEMPSHELKIWAALNEEPAALLMLSAVIAFEQIIETELVS